MNFNRFIPLSNLKNLKSVTKKNLQKFISKTIENLKNKNHLLNSLNKDYKLNFNFSELKKYKKFKRIIILGMGGSILGTEAIGQFLTHKIKKKIIFLNNLDEDLINKINKTKDLKNSLFLIISKSGNTVEVLSIIDSIKNKANFNNRNTLIITENNNNDLSFFAQNNKIKIIFHKKHIGGRYSVFSETGLVPCYLMGINISKFKKNTLDFLRKDKNILIKNLINMSKIYSSKKINSLILLNYCSGLDTFLLWCQQLIAESLGKKGRGLIPIISKGPRDHHSLLQLFLDGPQDKFFYLFSIKEKNKIKNSGKLFKRSLNKSNSYKVIQEQKNAFLTILKNKNIPHLSIEIKKRDEATLGKLFSYFIFETIFLGEDLKINPFNQPAVEQVKIITKKNLFKGSKHNL
tara:strand:+ start:3208 stop:4419 length:1212 start_codon:yes stop_codon:yes gene_type:complete